MAGPAVLDHVDPSRTATFPVHIGSSISGKSYFSTVQFNHKPSQAGNKRDTHITKSKRGPNDYDLVISDVEDEDEDEEDNSGHYIYHGRQHPQKTSCALLFDRLKQAFTLERLDSAYSFNLVSAPWETDAQKLKKQYTQLELEQPGTPEEDALLGNEDEPDADNPYDHRHFLTTTAGDSPISSAAPTPRVLSPVVKASKPVEVSKKRKQPGPRRPQDRAPKIHVENADEDRGGGLIIEMDDDERPTRRHADSRGRPASAGPISLRAAATSQSPAMRSRRMHSPRRTTTATDHVSSGDDDADVTTLQLPAPAVNVVDEMDVDDDDAADLEAELEQAFEGQDDDEPVGLGIYQESDAESEEE